MALAQGIYIFAVNAKDTLMPHAHILMVGGLTLNLANLTSTSKLSYDYNAVKMYQQEKTKKEESL